jgi:hypothetical protein
VGDGDFNRRMSASRGDEALILFALVGRGAR